jgi:polyvinyl alcohol dehydrogenase (cytochrome)
MLSIRRMEQGRRFRRLRIVGSPRAASLLRRSFVVGCAGVLLAIVVQSAGAAPPTGSWSFAGNDVTNSRTQSAETTISSSNVGQLAVKWTAPTHGDVSATPTVANGVVYFPDWGGYINAVNAQTGAVIWQKQLYADYGEPAPVPFISNWVSRTSPAIYGNEVIFGDNNGAGYLNLGVGANVLAVDAQTGNLLWKTTVDTDPNAVITANPVVAGGKLIVGVSSNEEGVASGLYGPYACCTFRGKVLALNPNTGAIQWSTYTVPSNSGAGDSNLPCTGSAQTGDDNPTGCDYTGGAVWDTPAIDLDTGMVFIGTGNNYTTPDSAVACEQLAMGNNTSDANCTAPNDYFDSVLALNLSNGSIVWGHKVAGWDAWTVACFFLPPGVTWCPSPLSPDYDFGGSGPNLMKGKGPKGASLVGIGQKSGVYWAFDEKTGATVWNTLVGPGSALGGIEWGTAFDGGRIIVPIANSYGIPYTLANGQTASGGSWAALDPKTGKFDWQVPTPDGSMAIGAASEANGVVYAGDSAGGGSNNMFALAAGNGKILWSFPASGSVWSGPAIVDGVVYWGSGYGRFASPNTDNKFYAFSINGQ